MEKGIPPELVAQIVEILETAFTIAIGWVARWLSYRKQSKHKNNE